MSKNKESSETGSSVAGIRYSSETEICEDCNDNSCQVCNPNYKSEKIIKL